MLCPVLGYMVKERHGYTGASPVKGHEEDKATGGSDIQEETRRAVTVQPREEES